MDKQTIAARLRDLPGDVGLYYKDLTAGEAWGFNEEALFEAASVIKLPVYAVVMKLWAEGKLDLGEKLLCRQEDKLPPCGALYFFTGEVEADIRTLCGGSADELLCPCQILLHVPAAMHLDGGGCDVSHTLPPFGICCVRQWIFPPPVSSSRAGTGTIRRSGHHVCISSAASASLCAFSPPNCGSSTECPVK